MSLVVASRPVSRLTYSPKAPLTAWSDLSASQIEADMVDSFGNPAFIPVHQYGAATGTVNGEIGAVGDFRIVLAPEMMHWAGGGATLTTNAGGFRNTGGNFDVFPSLVVGSESFTTIGFQTDGKTVKFKIRFAVFHKMRLGFVELAFHLHHVQQCQHRVRTLFVPVELTIGTLGHT